MILSPGKGPAAGGRGLGSGEEVCKKNQRNRTTFTTYQLYQVERAFEASHYPDVYSREELVAKVHLPKVHVQVWFQNCRAKWHRQEHLESGSGSIAALRPPEAPTLPFAYPPALPLPLGPWLGPGTPAVHGLPRLLGPGPGPAGILRAPCLWSSLCRWLHPGGGIPAAAGQGACVGSGQSLAHSLSLGPNPSSSSQGLGPCQVTTTIALVQTEVME